MEKRKRIIFIVYILYMAGYETCRIIIGRGTRDAVNRENSDVCRLVPNGVSIYYSDE